jgi:hypothetical protein
MRVQNARRSEELLNWIQHSFLHPIPLRVGPSSFQGFSHAERPKDTAPLQSGSTIHFPPKSVDAEYRPPKTKRFWKRATKLRAISRAGPGRDPVRQHCRRGKLLPTRRTLLQIDVRGPRRSIVSAVTEFLPTQLICRVSVRLLSNVEGASIGQKLDVTRRRPAPHYLFTGEVSAPPDFARCFGPGPRM